MTDWNSLSVAEKAAIKAHYEWLRQSGSIQADLEYAMVDWLTHHAAAWREQRQRHCLELQRLEIQKHKWIESEKARRDLGAMAVMDWIQKHAAAFRNWYEREYNQRESI